MELRDLVRALKRFRLPAVGVFVAVLALGLAAAFIPANKYRATATLLVEPSGDNVDFSDVEAIQSSGTTANATAAATAAM